MSEDGRDEPAHSSNQQLDKGQMLLTLCHLQPANGVREYPHAVIPFAESYEIACQQARRVFSENLPHRTGNIVLKYAMQRISGKTVWCIITPEVWKDVLKRNGEEIGVFLPNALNAPYDENVQLHLTSPSSLSQLVIEAITSYQKFQTIINKGNPVVIECWAPGYPPKEMTFSAIFENVSEGPEGLVFYKVDVGKHNDILIETSIRSVPAFVLFKDGKKIADIGRYDGHKLQAFINAAA